MIAHEKGFKFHAQPQTGAYSCFLCNQELNTFLLVSQKAALGIMATICIFS